MQKGKKMKIKKHYSEPIIHEFETEREAEEMAKREYKKLGILYRWSNADITNFVSSKYIRLQLIGRKDHIFTYNKIKSE